MESSRAEPPASPIKNSPLAVAALGVALLSYLCLWGVGGLVALVLGLAARLEIRTHPGRFVGRRMAAVAIALGALNVAVTITALGVATRYWLERPIPKAAVQTVNDPPTPPAGDSTPLQGPAPGHYSEDPEVRTVKIGRVVLIDLGPGVFSLRDELNHQRKLAAEAKTEVVVWVVAPRCGPCNGVSAALADPLMQRALGAARLVRVDRSRFAPELADLGIPYDTIPGFALLGEQNRPLDYIHGGEWDEDIAPNIAPVLGEFVRGTYKARRQPWRGIKRRDETAL